MSPHPASPPILVAVDASLESLAALDWAIDFADTRGHALRVVTAVSPRPAPASDSAGSYQSASTALEDQVRKRVELLILGPLRRSGLAFEHIVTVGSIDRVMARHSVDATFAVIGTRHISGWRGLLRRSATKRLTGKLDCPLVSITGPARPANTSLPRPVAPKALLPVTQSPSSSELIGA